MSIDKVKKGWVVRHRENGVHKSKLFDKSLGYRREHAEDYEREVKLRKRGGAPTVTATERRFEDYVRNDWWPTHAPTLKTKTQENYAHWANHYLIPFFGDKRLNEIWPNAVQEFHADMIRREVGEPARAAALKVLSVICTHAVRAQLMPSNPVSVIRKPQGFRQRIIQPFPPERVEAVRGYFLEHDDLGSATFVSLLAYAGPRPSEALSLTWADISDTYIVFKGDKTGRDRATRLLAPLSDDLNEWKGHVQLGKVFPWTENQYRHWRAEKFSEATKAAGIENTRPYDLRHAFATLLLQEGVALSKVARNLGHSVSTCERWYAHLEDITDDTGTADERIYAAREQIKEAANG